MIVEFWQKMWPAIAVFILMLTVLYLPVVVGKLLKRARDRGSMYATTTVALTRDHGAVIVCLGPAGNSLVPAETSAQSAQDYPPTLEPEDLLGGETQWTAIVSRLEISSGIRKD